MTAPTLRTMNREDWDEVAELIHLSTNYWYETNRNLKIFPCRPDEVDLFCRVYEALRPQLLSGLPYSHRPDESSVRVSIIPAKPTFHWGS